VVVHADTDEADVLERLLTEAGARPMGRSPRQAAYVLTATPCEAAERTRGTALDVVSITDAPGGPPLQQLRDGNPRTLWTTRQVQRGGEQLTVDLGRPRRLTEIVVDQGSAAAWFPRGLRVDSSVDGVAWTPRHTGSTVRAAVCSALRDPRRVPVTFVLDADARYVRLTQTGADTRDWWAVADVRVFGVAES
jgi:hypothetical protein